MRRILLVALLGLASCGQGGAMAPTAGPVETDSELPYETQPSSGPSNNGLIGLDPKVSEGSIFALGGRGEHVELAPLTWLASRQRPDGGWDELAGPEDERSGDPGLTGRVLLAYLAGRYTNRGQHDYAKTVSRGLRYLKNVQGPRGWYGPPPREGEDWPRDLGHHGPALAAMLEAYAQTHSPIFKGSAQAGLAALAAACADEDPGLRDPATSYPCLLALLSATGTNRAFEKDGKQGPFDLEVERFGTLARQRRLSSDAGPEDVAAAVLARRVFDDPADVEAGLERDALARDLRARPTAWTTDTPQRSPVAWALVHAAIELTPDAGNARDQLAAREILLANQAKDSQGRPAWWAPRDLPGGRAGPVRLTALALASLWRMRVP